MSLTVRLILFAAVTLWGFISIALSTLRGNLGDFGCWLSSAMALAGGQNPYGVYGYTPHFVSDGQSYPMVNMNPPLVLVFFSPLTNVEPTTAFNIWYGFSFVGYLAILVVLGRRYGESASPLHMMWALALGGFSDTLKDGQVYIALLAIAVAAWLLLENGKTTTAGVLIGFLVALKPNLALWPGLLFLAGYHSVALWAIGIAGGLSLLPVLLYGPEVYLQWIEAVGRFSYVWTVGNGSLSALTFRMGIPWLSLILGAALIIWLSVWAWRSRPSSARTSELALAGALLTSPLAWTGYTLLLLPAFLRRGRWSVPLVLGGTLLLVPQRLQALLIEMLGVTALYPMYTLALLLVLFGLMGRPSLPGRIPQTLLLEGASKPDRSSLPRPRS